MKTVYASFDTILLGYLVGVLKSEGVEAELRNLYSAGAFGELPPSDAMPEVQVDESKFELARQIVDEALSPENNCNLPEWQCPECGEQIEGQYGQCWNCGYMQSRNQTAR